MEPLFSIIYTWILSCIAKASRLCKIWSQEGASDAGGGRSKASGTPPCSYPSPLLRNRCNGGCKKKSRLVQSSFAVQVNPDGWRICSQEGSRSFFNKLCTHRGDSKRSCSQTRKRAASDVCCRGRWETYSFWQCGKYSSSFVDCSAWAFLWWDTANIILPVRTMHNWTKSVCSYSHGSTS